MAAENRVIEKIRKYVLSKGGKMIKIHQTACSELGTPDLLISLPSTGMFLVETKALGEEPTPIQYQRIKEWNETGGKAFWCDSFDSFLEKITK